MKVPIEDDWMSPCTLLVDCALAMTLPDELFRRHLVGDQILEAGVDALERGGLRIGDVAGNVFQRVGLRLDAADRSGQCTEDTHDVFSNVTQPPHNAWPQVRVSPQQAACHGERLGISMG